MLKGLKSLLTGIIAGTAIGVLFSPQGGKEIRKNIKKEIDQGGSGIDTVKSTLTKMGKDLSETSKKAYEKVNESEDFQKAKSTVKKAIKENIPEEQRKKVKKTYQKAKKTAKKTVTKAKKTVEKARNPKNKNSKK
jgi:gas vesicle protein